MNDLMTLEDIATMFRCTPEKARKLLALPGFPADAPVSTKRHRLWVRAEVRAFKPLASGAKEAVKLEQTLALRAKSAAIEARTAANRRHHRAKRRTAQLLRTPPWADLKAIEQVYRDAVRLEAETGIPHAVDHVLPLQGRRVSGLHVAANLQVLPAAANLSKGNRYEVEA